MEKVAFFFSFQKKKNQPSKPLGVGKNVTDSFLDKGKPVGLQEDIILYTSYRGRN